MKIQDLNQKKWSFKITAWKKKWPRCFKPLVSNSLPSPIWVTYYPLSFPAKTWPLDMTWPTLHTEALDPASHRHRQTWLFRDPTFSNAKIVFRSNLYSIKQPFSAEKYRRIAIMKGLPCVNSNKGYDIHTYVMLSIYTIYIYIYCKYNVCTVYKERERESTEGRTSKFPIQPGPIFVQTLALTIVLAGPCRAEHTRNSGSPSNVAMLCLSCK